jgi:hypothetical protein
VSELGQRRDIGHERDRRQRRLPDDHRVQELHRDVLGVGGRAEDQQPATCRELGGHVLGCQRQGFRLFGEVLQGTDASQKGLIHQRAR